MNKTKLLILSILISIKIFSQNNEGVQKIVTMSDNDTIELEQYDKKGNLIFNKIFPQYGVSQILTHSYINNKLISYTWSHSNIGFIENEYEYDSLKNIINIYSYENKEKSKDFNLMSFYSIESLKNSNEFKQYIKQGIRYLKSTQYLEDTLITKQIDYNFNGSIEYTIYFTYENGKLIRRKQIYGQNNAYNELIYEFDKLGNEIQWMKVFDSSDTSCIYKKVYENNLLIEEIGIEDGKISSKEYYNYLNGKLISIKQYDKNGILKISSEFYYNQNGKIDYIFKINNYMGIKSKAKYYYE